MKFKKLASLALTGVMIASMSMSAFAFGVTPTTTNNNNNTPAAAASTTANGATVPVASTVKTATIDIDVATATDVVLNPYQMPVEVNGSTTQGKFLSTAVVATNKSTTKVDVTARVTVTANGEAKIVDDASAAQTASTDDPGDKNMYVALLVANVDTTDAPELTMEVTGNNALVPKLGGSAFSATTKYKVVPITASGTEVGFGSAGDEDETALTIEAGNDTNNYFAMQLFGDVNNRTASPWTASDTISASIVLTFKAQPLDVS